MSNKVNFVSTTKSASGDKLTDFLSEYFQIISHSKNRKLASFPTKKPIINEQTYQNILPVLKKLSSIFPRGIAIRNELARLDFKKDNYLNLCINRRYQIPEYAFSNYLKKRQEFLENLKINVSKFSLSPHFLSYIPPVNLNFPDGVFSLVSKDYPTLNRIKSNIKLVRGEEGGANFKYTKENHAFTISIPTNIPHNQAIAMLIHELAHVISFAENNYQIKSQYQSEKLAYQIEFKVTKKISDEFYMADLLEYLSSFLRTDFEIEAYTKPKINLPKLYGKLFNRTYHANFLTENYAYLIDEKILMQPFSGLHHAVAILEIHQSTSII